MPIYRFLFAAITTLCALAVPAHAQTIEYYHLDALGSVRAVTDQGGAVIERHDYLPFGEEVNPPNSAQPIQFTGQERDAETGMDYFGARYYSGSRARFTTIDPVFTWEDNLVDPQRWNRYAYVRNNPLRYTDPDGRIIFDFQEFKANVGLAMNFGRDGYGFVVPAVAGIAAIGSVASDALIATGGAVNVIRAVAKETGKRAARISMEEAIALGTEHVGGKGVMETTGKGTNFQFRNTTETAEGTVSRISRFDVNPADRHVRNAGPHLNREIHVNSKPVSNLHTAIDPKTIRKGDHP